MLRIKARHKQLQKKKKNVGLSVFWFHPTPKKQRWVDGPEAAEDRVAVGSVRTPSSLITSPCAVPACRERARWRDEEGLTHSSTFEKHALRGINISIFFYCVYVYVYILIVFPYILYVCVYMYFHTHLCTHPYIYIKQNKEPPEPELRDFFFSRALKKCSIYSVCLRWNSAPVHFYPLDVTSDKHTYFLEASVPLPVKEKTGVGFCVNLLPF